MIAFKWPAPTSPHTGCELARRFLCPSVSRLEYDYRARVLKALARSKELPVPPYEFASDARITIGVDEAPSLFSNARFKRWPQHPRSDAASKGGGLIGWIDQRFR